jgi:hypothetical protein
MKITNKKPAEFAARRAISKHRTLWQMSITSQHDSAQAGSAPARDRMTGQEALAIARDRFPNLCSTGILGRKFTGPPIDLADIGKALAFLRGCRKTKQPTVHTVDIVDVIGGVQVGAVIVGAVALGFGVHSFYGPLIYAPHALVAVSKVDVRRLATRSFG